MLISIYFKTACVKVFTKSLTMVCRKKEQLKMPEEQDAKKVRACEASARYREANRERLCEEAKTYR
jgi:hypothetical protein